MKTPWGFARVMAAVACLAAAVVCFLPAPGGAPAGTMRAAGVVIVAIGLWATAVVPEYFTSIIFFFLAVTVAGAPPEVVFSGFSSTAAWMVFGGLVIGLAVEATGLGARVAEALAGTFRGSYLGIIAGTVAVAALLAFVVPSNMGRIMVMLPIFLTFADRLGFAQGSNGRAAITLTVSAGTLYPSLGILTAAVPNLALLGAAESIHGVRLTYGQYLAMHFPVISVVSILALPVMIRVLFPDAPRPARPRKAATRYRMDERNLVLVLCACLALWMSDFAHGVSPAWIAMGAAVVCLLPRVGMIPVTGLMQKLNLGPWFFIAGVIGMSSLVSKSGVGDLMGRWLFSMVEFTPGSDGANFAALSAIGMAVGIVATVPGQPAIMVTLADRIAAATGWPLITVLMAPVTSWPMALFPYQLPPLVVAARLGGVRTGQVIRLLVAMAALGWLIIMPLQFAWWRYLGYFR